MINELREKVEQLLFNIDEQELESFSVVKNVLLTDGSTEIGFAVLEELLYKTEADVWVITQVDDFNNVQFKEESERLNREMLEKFGYSRVHFIEGKIHEERFGIDQEEWDELAGKIDVVIYNRCVNSFMKPYQLLYQTNVSPIFEIIKFSYHKKRKKVVDFSMANVLCGDNDGSECSYNEYDIVENVASRYGLVKSKGAVEYVLSCARDRGLPVLVMRFPHIVPSPKAKVWDKRDFLLLRVKLCIQMGEIPDVDFPYYLIPERTLAEIIVKFAQFEEGFFIPAIPSELTWNEILRTFLSVADRDYAMVPLERFVDNAVEYIKKISNRELSTVIPFLRMKNAGFDCPLFNNDDFMKSVAKYDIYLPDMKQIANEMLGTPIGEWLIGNE